MKKKAINVDFLSSAGPYSHIVQAGDFLFLSGQLPIDIRNNIAEKGDIKKATAICLDNIKKTLEHMGSSMDKVVKVTVFLTEMAWFNDMNEVYKQYFKSEFPARTCIAVKAIPGGFPIEIEAIAIK